jgi:lysophospholipase L1-like esterase
LRIRVFLGITACVGAIGCGKLGAGNGSPTAPGGTPAAGSTINYSALGASDANGIGSSVPCFADCPNGTGYVFVTERALRAQGYTVNLTLLGIPTATIGPDFQALGLRYGRTVAANLIEFLAPFVTHDATLVTIFTGGNDVEVILDALAGGAGGSDPAGFIDAQVRAFAADYATLLTTVRGRSASARIIALNLPNFASIPLYAGAPLSTRQAAQRASVGITTTVVNPLTSQGVTVVDLMCRSTFYNGLLFSSDGFHPNDNGYAMLANLIVEAATSSSYPTPSSTCSEMSVVQ